VASPVTEKVYTIYTYVLRGVVGPFLTEIVHVCAESGFWFRVEDLDGMGGIFTLVQGLGFRVQGSGFRVQGLGFGVEGFGFRV
jgi:hypothetical protein